MTKAIIVHGGCKTIPDEEREAHRRGCVAAVQAGWEVLDRGGAAVDAVEAAIRVLEADPTFNAGFGSTLNPDGMVRMDAGLMEGAEFKSGAVACVEGVRNPISVARRLVEEPPILVVADYARRYAEEQGLELCAPEEMISEKQLQSWQEKQKSPEPVGPTHDTVGCVAMDVHGNIAAGASTGGTGDKRPGRVGDSPIPGCGFYADRMAGGCSMTGEGEAVIQAGVARTVVDQLRHGALPDEAAWRALQALQGRVQGEAGAILIDRTGRTGWAHNGSDMAVGYFSYEMDQPAAFTHKREEGEGQRAAA